MDTSGYMIQEFEALCATITAGSEYSTIEPLVKSSLLAIPDNQENLPLHLALEHQCEESVIKLMIRENPAALICPDNGNGDIFRFVEESASAVSFLLVRSYNAYKKHHFEHLVELCGTSAPLLALIAAHTEDSLSLDVLCFRKDWPAVQSRLHRLRARAAVDEIFAQDGNGGTALARAVADEAPLAVLESMIVVSGMDGEKRNILDIATIDGCLPLHLAALFRFDQGVIELLVRNYPRGLLAETVNGQTPGHFANVCDGAAADVDVAYEDVFRKKTMMKQLESAYSRRDYLQLMTICATSPTLIRLHSYSLRVATMACVERTIAMQEKPKVDEVTKKVVWLLQSILEREKGIVRDILSYLGGLNGR